MYTPFIQKRQRSFHVTGILMYYADFPLGTQAIHLLSGALLFGVQFYLWMQSRRLVDNLI